MVRASMWCEDAFLVSFTAERARAMACVCLERIGWQSSPVLYRHRFENLLRIKARGRSECHRYCIGFRSVFERRSYNLSGLLPRMRQGHCFLNQLAPYFTEASHVEKRCVFWRTVAQ